MVLFVPFLAAVEFVLDDGSHLRGLNLHLWLLLVVRIEPVVGARRGAGIIRLPWSTRGQGHQRGLAGHVVKGQVGQ